MPDRSSKIAIVGAGGVGAAIAYACMIRGVAKQLAVYDVNRAKVDAEVLDLNHGLQFVPPATVEGSDDVAVCADADIVVITAGAKQKPGQTRMDLAQANADICRKIIPQLQQVAPRAMLLLVTNPVDVMTYVAMKVSGLPPRRVVGSGTVLDSSRFRFLIAQRLNVAVQNVHAYIAGEHGDSEVPLWRSANVGNIPIADWSVPGHGRLGDQDRADIVANVRNAAYQIIKGKGATTYAIGLATARILEALLRDENRILPVSSLLSHYRPLGHKDGDTIDDVCLSVPCVVNRTGIDSQLQIPMDDAEWAALKRSGDVIREAIRHLGF
jgi:L-lactate dehydrogenase